MFRALRQSELPPDNVFTVTVGPSSKQTLAAWHVLEPTEILSTIGLLTGNAESRDVGDSVIVDSIIPSEGRS
jgi:trehalose 6-phosphate synthase/phosphatase